MEKLSFDGVLTGANGEKIDVDCDISLPVISGAAASVTVHVPQASTQHAVLTNPCTLRGRIGLLEVQINELWYRRLPLGGTGRKHARDVLDINHIGSLKVNDNRLKSKEASVVFHLSPVAFFKCHAASAMTSYSSTPNQTVTLFRICAPGIGEIVFQKQWAVHHIDEGTTSAKIHAGFYAHVACHDDGIENIDAMVDTFREVLTVLSVLFRQAVSLLGWEKRCRSRTEKFWVDPLEPNLAPYMALTPNSFLAFPDEFEKCAEELVNKHLAMCKRVKKVIRALSVSIAPHISVSGPPGFLAMFGALERAVGVVKVTASEKQKLGASNAELISHLQRTKIAMEAESSAFTEKLLERVDGFIKVVGSGSLSFSAKLAALFKEYPALSLFAADLWPIEGSEGKLGLKEIRNKLTHGVDDTIESQALAVAHWHFSIFIERLIFVMVGADVPKGIRRDSYLFTRDEWYRRDYWTPLQKPAQK